MTKTMIDYFQSGVDTGIEEIRIVVYERDTLTAQVCQHDLGYIDTLSLQVSLILKKTLHFNKLLHFIGRMCS